MSIIYDALQKTQRNREYLRLQSALTQKKSHRRHLKWTVLSSLILIVGGGMGAMFSFYGMPGSPVSSFHPVANSVQPESTNSAHLWVTDSKKTTEAPLPAPIKSSLPVAPVLAQSQVPSPVLAPQQPAAVKPAVVQEAASLLTNPKLNLNGVLISGDDKIALINNQSFRLGDLVDGMKIIAIEFNKVKLQTDKQIIELRV